MTCSMSLITNICGQHRSLESAAAPGRLKADRPETLTVGLSRLRFLSGAPASNALSPPRESVLSPTDDVELFLDFDSRALTRSARERLRRARWLNQYLTATLANERAQ